MNLQATYRENIFNSVEEMEKHVQDHIYNKGLTGNVKKVLICIKQYSKLNKGVCKLKAETIAEKVEISVRTVMRVIKKLIEMKVIQKENCTKLNGIKGANVYIILPHGVMSDLSYLDTTEKPCNNNDSHEILDTEYINSFKSFNSFNLLNNQINTSNNNLYNTYYNTSSNAYMTQRNVKNELLNIYKPVSQTDEMLFNELCKVAFGLLKKYRQMYNISFNQMADIVTNCMNSLMHKTDVEKPCAMYSKMITNQVNRLMGIEQPKQVKQAKQETLEDLAKRSKEKVPDWYFKRDEEQPQQEVQKTQAIDFEAERAKILAKLGAC